MLPKITGILLLLLRLQGCLSAVAVDVQPSKAIRLPGQNVTFLCRVGVRLQYCRVKIPSLEPLNLNNNSARGDISYFGSGLQNGQCGVSINSVKEEYNGPIKCYLGISTEAQESSGTMHLTVAKAPRAPQLILSRGIDSVMVYKINDVLQASCIVSDVRPAANISWYLGDELLDSKLTKTIPNEDTFTNIENVTKTLEPSDNGKELKCVALHPAYPNGYATAAQQLDVRYPPLPQGNPIERFGYTLGQNGKITVEIEANPKPEIEWEVRQRPIKEDSYDSTGRIKALRLVKLDLGRYEASLEIAEITKADTATQYILKAHNIWGDQQYYIQISTSPEPEGLELGAGAIIAIVVSILFVLLLVFLLIFARITGRWCFSGGTRVIDYTGGESGADHPGLPADGVDNPHHQASQEYINGNDLQIKKKEEKINTPV